MKIINYDGSFCEFLYISKEFTSFLSLAKIPEVSLDKDLVKDYLSSKVIQLFEKLDSEKSKNGRYSMNGTAMSVTGNELSKVSMDKGYSKADGDSCNLEEYYFWLDITNTLGDTSKKRTTEEVDMISRSITDFMRGKLDRKYRDYGSVISVDLSKYKTFSKLLEDFVFYINDIDKPTLDTEMLKTYLYPAINSSIDFSKVLKSLKSTKSAPRLIEAWNNSALFNSNDPKLFAELFKSVKRSNGYVNKKKKIIQHALDNGIQDKTLFKLFIEKSTITIRRELASFLSSSSYKIKNVKEHIGKMRPSIDSEDNRTVMLEYFRRLSSLIEQDYGEISRDDFLVMSKEERLELVKDIEDFFIEREKITQFGLIAISQEKDYNVQSIVVAHISKENSIWVVPNIENNHLKNALNNKMIGENV